MTCLKRLTYTSVILLLVFSFHLAAKTEPAVTIDEGKAHYIFEVMKHITWPNEEEISHFNILILGNNKNLLNALYQKTNSNIRGKDLSVDQLTHLNKVKGYYEVIYVSRNNLSLVPEITKKYNNSLVISDGEKDREKIMVALSSSKLDLKIIVNRENLIKHGFSVSNNLLDFAGTKKDLVDQLKDKESALKKVLHNVELKEAQLEKLNEVLAKNQNKLASIQANLAKQNSLLTSAQTQLNSLQNSKKSIESELIEQNSRLIKQQKLIAEKEVQQSLHQKKLQQLNFDIEQAEKQLEQHVTKLKQQNNIIERKEQKISGQRELLYLAIAVVLVILLLKFIVLRVSNIRKQANKELSDLNKQLYELATTDDMTKLFNRRHFLELAQRALNQLQRTKGIGAVFMIDIDHFKNINDSYGHAAGDKVIIDIARILQENLRDYDIVGRVGGEEFAMLLPNSDIDTATQIAERIREIIENLSITFKRKSLKVTISIGLTATLENESNVENIMKRADKALYLAKDSGRNAVVLI